MNRDIQHLVAILAQMQLDISTFRQGLSALSKDIDALGNRINIIDPGTISRAVTTAAGTAAEAAVSRATESASQAKNAADRLSMLAARQIFAKKAWRLTAICLVGLFIFFGGLSGGLFASRYWNVTTPIGCAAAGGTWHSDGMLTVCIMH